MELHVAIRKLREKKDLTQENIAAMVGVEKTTIGRYEKDASTISIDKLEKLAQSLGMTVPQLLTYEDEPTQVQEPVPAYGNVRLLVELDGSKEALRSLFERLERINQAIA